MQLFYTKDINENTSEIHFTKEESQHIIKVLRKKEDDILHITNGNGWLFKAKITSAHVKKCVAHIVQRDLQNPRNYRLHLAVAPTKMNDRFEWFLEKATEIGIDSITPILCDHSERKVIKHERYEKIIQSAMKQSLQCYLPTLHPLKAYQEFLDQEFVGQTFIAHCEETSKNTLKEEASSNNDVTILIGPEGDFSTQEIAAALAKGIKPVSLGNTRLRTETAAIVACHSIAFLNSL